jgi:hypothetical protein
VFEHSHPGTKTGHRITHKLALVIRHIDERFALGRVDYRALHIDKNTGIAHYLCDNGLSPFSPRKVH